MFNHLKILDVIDIALVSTLIYAAYTLFRRTRTARTLIGLVAIGIVYLLARQLDLRLTLTILQAFFAVIIIALIVILQDEFRRLFERIGNQRWFSLKGNWEQGTISSIEKRIL
jgi:diadenylate cyclase